MQDLFLLDTDKVRVQAQDKTYEDTLANFKKDYAKDIPYKYIDYNRDCASCFLDKKPFQTYPDDVCEDVLSSINTLLDSQTKRNTKAENTEEKEVQEDISDIENQLVNIKNDFVTALILNDSDTQEELKTQYLNFLTGDDIEDSTDTEEVDNGNQE